jgi:hypothetical protein
MGAFAPYGLDSQTGEYGNLVAKGIIDPTKVVRVAIQNAASVADHRSHGGRSAEEERRRRHACGRRHRWYGFLSPTLQRSKEKEGPGSDARRHSSALAELARTEDATTKCGLERFLRKRARRPLFSVGEALRDNRK